METKDNRKIARVYAKDLLVLEIYKTINNFQSDKSHEKLTNLDIVNVLASIAARKSEV